MHAKIIIAKGRPGVETELASAKIYQLGAVNRKKSQSFKYVAKSLWDQCYSQKGG